MRERLSQVKNGRRARVGVVRRAASQNRTEPWIPLLVLRTSAQVEHPRTFAQMGVGCLVPPDLVPV